MYHVTTDNAFPYRVCGGQQDSGSACVASRSNDGRITFNDWHPVGIQEYGYAAPDPLDPDIVYGGKVTRYDRRTGQIQDVAPEGGLSRAAHGCRCSSLQLDPKKLYFATNTLWLTNRPGKQLEGSQPGPEPRDVGAAATVQPLKDSPAASRDAARRYLCAGAVAARRESHLGGNG